MIWFLRQSPFELFTFSRYFHAVIPYMRLCFQLGRPYVVCDNVNKKDWNHVKNKEILNAKLLKWIIVLALTFIETGNTV
jgi:hypothetical protein